MLHPLLHRIALRQGGAHVDGDIRLALVAMSRPFEVRSYVGGVVTIDANGWHHGV